MTRYQWIFLAIVLAVTPGYRFRCWVFCSDQTAIQTDYTEARDNCRDYAQLKLDMAAKNMQGGSSDKSRKALLVSLFSDCMNQKGWSVPSVATTDKPPEEPMSVEKKEATAAGAAVAPNATSSVTTTAKQKMISAEERSALLRSSECNFARYAASTSSISAARAKACDLECAERLRAAPDAPRPAACPSDSSPILEKGRDSE